MASNTASSSRLRLSPADQVVIRMYGQGLGDCFLLAFPRLPAAGGSSPADAVPVYVLIDCGVIAGTPDGGERMRQVVADIGASTGNHLDLLIITHEHWDHLSSFVQAREAWEAITVDALWMAWTEHPDQSGLPEVLRKILEKQQRALAQIADQTALNGLSDQHRTAVSLAAFMSDAASDGLRFAAAPGVHDAYLAAKALVNDEARRAYCEPGEARPVPGTGVAAYVLGPPRGHAFLNQPNPKPSAPETFESAAHGGGTGLAPDPIGFADLDEMFSLERMVGGPSAFNAFAMPFVATSLRLDEDTAAGAPVPTSLDLAVEQDVYDRSFPFDRTTRVPIYAAEMEAAGSPEDYPALASYYNTSNHWRRIDFDWLAGAEAFALRADHLTNNISLALAFELPAARQGSERKVLLFPGDAQVGNWLSWDEIGEWKLLDGVPASQTQADVPDLLKRTVFYKVSHHGSHNATLKERGVERMRNDQTLTAFVPVSEAVARNIGWSRMPLPEMLNALTARAPGRVVFPDGSIWPLNPAQPREKLDARHANEFRVAPTTLQPKHRSKTGELLEGPVPLWVEVAIDY